MIRQTGRVTPLRQALDRLRSALPTDELADAVEIPTLLALADAGDLAGVTAPLLEAVIDGRVPASERAAVLARWRTTDDVRWDEVIDAAVAWWDEARWADPSEPAHLVLADLCHLDEPMSRWLQPWLDDLDGEPARHLAAAVLADWAAPGFAELPDQQQQCRSWAASEPVVFGFTLVGGVHLEQGELGAVFDRLVPIED